MGPTLFDEFAKPDLVAPGNRLISLRTPGSFIDTNFPENVIPVADYAPTAPPGTAVQLPDALGHQHVCAGRGRRRSAHDRRRIPTPHAR